MQMNGDQEAELVEHLQSNCPLAFRHLYDVYAPALYGTIHKMIHCPLASQDVLQNVFVKIWSNADQYQSSKGRLFTWMINITRHETFDYMRNKQYRQASLTYYGYEGTLEDGYCADRLLTRFDVGKLISQLPLKERAILQLYVEGFTCKEIGQLLGLPVGTVKTKMRTSYRKLRLALQN